MKNRKTSDIVLLVIYIVLSVIVALSLVCVAGGNFGWGFVISIEKLIIKSHYDFDIVVWGFWFAGVSAVLLIAILLIDDYFKNKKQIKEQKRKYKF